MKKFIQDLAVTGFGALSSLLTAILLAYIEINYGLAIYSVMWWFVIPIGAIGAGFVAAWGYYLGSKIFNHRPESTIMYSMLMISMATYFLLHFFLYVSFQVDGKQVSDLVSYRDFMDITIKNTSMRLRHGGETGALGRMGYVLAMFQILGFFAGGAITYLYLAGQIYCEKCSKYFSFKGKISRYYSDPEILANQYMCIKTMLDQSLFQKAVDAMLEKNKYKSDDYLWLVLEVQLCKKCKNHYMKLLVKKRNAKNEWEDVDKFTGEYYTGENAEIIM